VKDVYQNIPHFDKQEIGIFQEKNRVFPAGAKEGEGAFPQEKKRTETLVF
jgi:hypothetical protein